MTSNKKEGLSSNQQPASWPKVAVIIVNWNGEPFLGRCLSALQEQTVVPHDIILVDNASNDCSLDIVKRFHCVRLLSQTQNLGFARANNIAVQSLSPDVEWIALLNPDAFPEPHWLEELLLAARANNGYDILGSQLVVADNPSELDGAGDAYHISGRVWRIRSGVKISSEVREIFSPCAAAALYSRSAWVEVGGFDEDYFCYLEDVDLGFRLRLAGHRCLYVPSSVAHHLGSGTTGGQHSDFAAYHGHRNLMWTFVKNMPPPLFWLLLPLHLALNFGSVIWLMLRGQGRVVLRAKRDALRGLPSIWRKRQIIQQQRRVSVRDIWRVLEKRFWRVKG